MQTIKKNGEADVGGVRFVQTDPQASDFADEMRRELEAETSALQRQAMMRLRDSLRQRLEHIQAKIAWLDAMIGDAKPATKKTRAPYPPRGFKAEVLKRVLEVFKQAPHRAMSVGDLRELVRVNDAYPGDYMLSSCIKEARNRIRIETTGTLSQTRYIYRPS